MRGGQDDSLLSVEDALDSVAEEDSSSPELGTNTSPDNQDDVASIAEASDFDDGAGQKVEDYGSIRPGTVSAVNEVGRTDCEYKRQYKIRPTVGDKYKGKTGDALEFQLLDVDYKKLPFPRPGTDRAGPAEYHEGGFTIDAFGTSAEGHSVHVAIKGFLPYFFVNIPREFSEDECKAFTRTTNSRMAKQSGGGGGGGGDDTTNALVRCASVRRKSIWGYQRDKQDFLQIFCSSPETLRKTATVIRHWDVSLDLPKLFPKGPVTLQTYETNVDPTTRLSTDSSVVMSGWIRIEADKLRWCDKDKDSDGLGTNGPSELSSVRRTSWCDIDVAVNIADFKCLPHREDVAPFLIGSFDIECVPEGGRGFPDATKPLDRCVQIGTAVYRFGESTPLLNIVYTLGTATVKDMEHLLIKEFRSEEELLMAWQRLVVHELDLDMLTGHNIYKFDLNYIARRAELLKCKYFFELGRIRGRFTAIKSTQSESKAFGHNEFHYLPMTGRMQMDIYNLITKQYKLSSYKLDSMAKHFLGDEKDDVSPKQIFQYQVKDAHHRGIIAKYCAKDW
jgi:DNA polymerase delta subunit 1